MTSSLAGRGAVVTGAGHGIGEAIARALAGAGASVVLAARTAADVERLAGELRGRGAKAWAVPCDVSVEAEVRSLATRAREHLGAVDILAHSAGAGASAPLHKITLEDWNAMLAANATSAFLCLREFAPGMAERGWGRIVAVASVAGLEGAAYITHYAAAKHAVVGLVRAAAEELRARGVTANAVCPGYADTPMTERTIENVAQRTGRSRDQALAAVLAAAGQSRLVRPDEVAAAVLELCADAAATTTGQAIVIRPKASAS